LLLALLAGALACEGEITPSTFQADAAMSDDAGAPDGGPADAAQAADAG
jgi:hypothetical protein